MDNFVRIIFRWLESSTKFENSVDKSAWICYNRQALRKSALAYEPLAQLAEHLTFNQRVRGSNPRWLTRKAHRHYVRGLLFFD